MPSKNNLPSYSNGRVEALIKPPNGNLTLLSKVMLRDLLSIDKRRITRHYGTVSDELCGALKKL